MTTLRVTDDELSDELFRAQVSILRAVVSEVRNRRPTLTVDQLVDVIASTADELERHIGNKPPWLP